MITLENFYDLISRNAQVTLVNTRYRTNIFTGSVRDIPDEYSACPVEDFSMNDSGHLTFKIKVKETRPAGNGWTEGTMRVGNGIYHYWVKSFAEGSKYGIDGGRISKLMMKRKGEIVCNYDRGWDVEPVDEETEIALEIMRREFN